MYHIKETGHKNKDRPTLHVAALLVILLPAICAAIENYNGPVLSSINKGYWVIIYGLVNQISEVNQTGSI